MIPTLAAPNIQVAPPVDLSVFTAPSPEPALGRLPLNIVPPPVTNPKVADNRPGQQATRGTSEAPAGKGAAASQTFFLAANGEIALESPYSTTFVAQLFGQFALADGRGVADGFLDFEQLAQFNMIKYKPSLAFRPRNAAPPPAEGQAVPQAMSQPETEASADAPIRDGGAVGLRDMPVAGSDSAPLPQKEGNPSSFSIFASGMGAYDATQSRNLVVLTPPDSRGAGGMAEISLVS